MQKIKSVTTPHHDRISVFGCIRSRSKRESSIAMVMARIGHATGYHLVFLEGRLVLSGGGDGEGRGQAEGLGGDGGPGRRDRGIVSQ